MENNNDPVWATPSDYKAIMEEPAYLSPHNIQAFIDAALEEDIGRGDYSSLAAIPEDTQNRTKLLIKSEGIVAGVALAKQIFYTVDPTLEVSVKIEEGNPIHQGDIVLTVQGNARAMLSAERLVLNCMQRMSGIATYTRHLQSLISHTHTRLLDTRKTTPNFRLPEKWAVAIGGGTNHRFALYDMVMLKDNHVDFAGGIAQAIRRTRQYLKENKLDLRIEIETRNLQEVREVMDTGGVDVIMLDNMPPDMMREAVALIAGRYVTEASGGINEQTIAAVAECGVDYISVGALTHSAKSLDMSLKAF